MSRINKKCILCNKEFNVKLYRKETAHYCSKKCYETRNPPKKFSCLFCKKEFSDYGKRLRIYCSRSCANKANFNLRSEPKHMNNFRKFWERRGIINQCERCGYKECIKILGLHHKDRNPKNNKRDNLEVLCPNCHSLEHQKHIIHGSKVKN